MSRAGVPDPPLYRDYVHVPYVKGTVLVLSPDEFLLALRRGKIVQRAAQHARRGAVAARRRRASREGNA